MYICSPHAMCPNFTCIFTLCLSIFMHNIYLGYEKNRCGGCNFEMITFDYIYPFFKKTYFGGVSKICSTKYENRCGGCNFEMITFDYIYPFFKKTYFGGVSKICSTKYDFNISYLLCPKPLIITGVT